MIDLFAHLELCLKVPLLYGTSPRISKVSDSDCGCTPVVKPSTTSIVPFASSQNYSMNMMWIMHAG